VRALVPDFIIGGAPRSGTTYLATALDRHPQVLMAKPLVPEPKVFLGPAKSNEEYRRIYSDFFKDVEPGLLFGEKSTAYFENEDVPERLHRFFHIELKRKVKLIFIVREPIARAYSNYLRTRSNGMETLSFMEAIEKEGGRPSPFPPDRDYVRPFAYASRGFYDVYADRYLRLFGPDEVHFMLFEDIERANPKWMKPLLRFLNLPSVAFEDLDPGIVNSAGDRRRGLSEEDQERLRPLFKDHVDRFQDLTRLDVSGWGYG
jgi:hypothetical protein